MAGKVRTWVWVVVAIAVVCVLCLVAFAGVAAYFVSQHIKTSQASPSNAAHEFDAVKAGFAGQKPLIELDSRGHFLKAHTDRTPPPGVHAPDQLHLLAFDPGDRRMVRFTLPFWLLRLKAGSATIDLNGDRMDLEDLRITVADLERHGPSLILDHTGPEGERVLVWSK